MPVSRRSVLLALALCGLLAAPTAFGQDRGPTPSAEELWKAYPLDQGEPAPTISATPTSARTSTAADRSGAQGGSGSDVLIVAILIVIAAIGAAGGWVVMRRRHSADHTAGLRLPPRLALAGPSARASRLTFTPSSGGPRPPQERAPNASQGVPPPDTARGWTAEIQWRESSDRSRFCVVARDREGGGESVIARSEPLDWPPADGDAVQALVAATDALTEALVAAGWKPVSPGTAWYEKRFEWEPAAAATGGWAPPRPGRSAAAVARPSGRFRTPALWPEGATALWRCEIKWKSGYARSRFEVVLRDPARGSDRVIATSAPFKWMLTADPDPTSPAFRDAVRALAGELESTGWERIGVGGAWYAVRYIWRGENPPPEAVEGEARLEQ